MKKTFLLFVLVLFMGFALSAAGEEKQEMSIKDMEPFCYAYMDFGGSFEGMGKAMESFMAEFFKQGLTPVGPPLGVYHNDPMKVKEEELKWAVGFPISKGTEVKAPLKKEETKFKKAVVSMYTGPYDKMDETYTKILKYIEDKGYKVLWPTYEKYLSNPQTTKPEELKTEVIVPVEKK